MRAAGWTVGLAGYALWTGAVRDWAARHGHTSLLTGMRPKYAGVAAMTFWPVVGLVWVLIYPGDVWPRGRGDD
jgi:hypothetical protein